MPWSTNTWLTATRADALRCATSWHAGCSTILWSISTALDAEARAYFVNQRGVMAARLCDATGLVAEQRAEGLALVDEAGALTDVAMPAEGTDAHATLLVAEFLATAERRRREIPGDARLFAAIIREQDVVDFLRDSKNSYGHYWRKSAREPGAERELAADSARATGKAATDRARCRHHPPAAGARPLRARRGRNQ